MTAIGPRLQPLRPVTYRADRSRRLEDVTMKPVEAWDDERVRLLAAGRGDHVLHVVAPGGAAGGAATLDRWRSAGVVDLAEDASLYGWSWEVAGRRVRGVAGAVELPSGDRLLPHERVRSDIVAARSAGIARAGVQAEPIVVLHDGDPLALAGSPPAGTSPVVELVAPGERHQVWALRDPGQVAALAAALADGPAPVVADGHHRLAALNGLAGHRLDSHPRSTHALVLVVDVAASDLSVRSIHRVVPRLDRDRVAASTGARPVPVPDGGGSDYLRAGDPTHLRYVLADRDGLSGLDLPVEVVHALHPAAGSTCSSVARDTCHLHSHLLPAWQVAEADVSYVHDWTQARQAASALGGLAIATTAPQLSDVLASARTGHLLPHKATSIGPKPRVGLLMFDGCSVAPG